MRRRIRVELTERVKRHIIKHGVNTEEIISVFQRDYFVKRDGKRYTVVGKTRVGRSLVLILDNVGEHFVLITARDATKAEKDLYRRKAK
jgi:uncharacterized DUF497 family protein